MKQINLTKAISLVIYGVFALFGLGVLLPAMVSAPNTIMSIGGIVLTILAIVVGGVLLWNKVASAKAGSNVALLILVSMMAVGCSRVDAGNVGIKVYLLGGEKGVDSEELGVGRYWIGINEDLYIFPTFTQNYVWTQDVAEGSENDESITFQTKEGMEVGADVGISYRIDPTQVTTIFEKYRRGIEEITDTFLRNMVRDAFVTVASTVPVESAYGEGKADLVKSVESMVKDQVSELGIIIERIYLVGKFRLPPQVTKALNAKIQATQRAQEAQNKVVEATALADQAIEQARGVAESKTIIAKAEAAANKILNASLSKSLIEYEKAKRWDGKLPQVSGSTSTFMDMRAK